MAIQDPQTTGNVALPLKVNGHVALQKTVKTGFERLDAYITALEARVAALEATSPNDSNSQFNDSNSQFT